MPPCNKSKFHLSHTLHATPWQKLRRNSALWVGIDRQERGQAENSRQRIRKQMRKLRIGGWLPMLALGMVMGTAGTQEKLHPVEKLGQPCRARNVLAGRLVLDRATGQERLV